MRLHAMRQTGDPFRNRKMNGPDPIQAESPSTALAGLRSSSFNASATPRASGPVTAARAMASGRSGVMTIPLTKNAADCQPTRGGTRSMSSRPMRRSSPDLVERELGVAPAEPAREGRGDSLRRRRVLSEELEEPAAVEAQHFSVRLGADRRRARLIDEQGELADVVPRSDHVDEALAVPVRHVHAEPPAHDDVQPEIG